MHILDQIFQGEQMYKIKFKSGEVKEFKTLVGADLRYAELFNHSFKNTSFRGADLRYADLREADLVNASFVDADLRDANLECSDLRNANFIGCNLTGARLGSAKLRNAEFGGANLTYANLHHVDANHASFINTTLHYTNLRYADLRNAYLLHADILDAGLNHCTSNSKNLYTIHHPSYIIVVTPTHFHIGCESHTRKQWELFTRDQIEYMDGEKALRFWYQSGVREILFELP